MTCPICKSVNSSHYLSLYDDRYAYPSKFKLFTCKACEHKYLQANFSPEELRNLYSTYYPRSSFNLESYQPHTEIKGFKAWFNGINSSAFRSVPKNVRVLDVGCGFGHSLGYHASRGCDVYGVEADENIRRVADKFGFKVHVGLFDPEQYSDNFFDYVTMDQVIEHVTDPVSTMRGVAKVLKPGGIAILSTPNANGWGVKFFGRRWINWHTPYHMQFFSRCSMQMAARDAGFCIAKIRTTTNSEWLYYQLIHMAAYPKEGELSSFWSAGTHQKTYAQKIVLRALYWMHKSKINHLLTRLFDSLGVGDNYVFVLEKK